MVDPQLAANADIKDDDDNPYIFAMASNHLFSATIGSRPMIIDSGVSRHFCPFCELFTSIETISPCPINIAGGPTLTVIAKGNVAIQLSTSNKLTTLILQNTLFVPGMHYTLVSASCLDDAGLAVHIEHGNCQILS